MCGREQGAGRASILYQHVVDQENASALRKPFAGKAVANVRLVHERQREYFSVIICYW